MLPILRRFLVSVALCGALYAGYAFCVVPVIEPAVERRESADSADAGSPSSAPVVSNRFEPLLEKLFPPEAWQVQRPKVAEDDGFVFLFRDFRQMEDGRVELKPCTLLVFSDKSADSDDVASLLPTVITADEGAILQFDSDTAARSGRFGRFQSGRLPGEVRVTRPESKPGAGDALSFTTSNIQIDMQKIWTPHDVSFRYGSSYGSGSDLTITLLPSDNKSGGASITGAAMNGIKFVELVRLNKLHLELPKPQREATDALTEPNAADGAQTLPRPASRNGLFSSDDEAPLEITCQGSFRMDVQERIASFDDRVEVVRLRGDGPSDQLTCQQLLLYFFRPAAALPAPPSSTAPPEIEVPADEAERTTSSDRRGAAPSGVQPAAWNETTATTSAATASASSTAAARRRPMLEVERIVATGAPVMLHASSVGARASGERLEYNVASRLIHLEDSQRSLLEQAGQRIEAPQLQYQMAEDPSRLGRAWASGPGRLVGVSRDGSQFETSWGEELRLRPQNDLHVLSLRGGTSIRMPGFGQFDAQVLHAWLRETPHEDGKSGILPDRLLAQGQVRFDSPRLSGVTQELQAWFRPVEATESIGPGEREANQRNSASSGPGRSISYGASNSAPETVQRKTNVTGDLLRIQVLQSGSRSLLDQLAVKGRVVVTELGEVETEDGRLRIEGEELNVDDADTEQAVLRITGRPDRPARIAARGMSLVGAEIQMSQIENRLWIDGEGQMTLPPIIARPKPRGNVLFENTQPLIPQPRPGSPSRDAADNTTRPQPFTISWKGRLDFDGQTARFQREVQVRGTHKLDSGEVLELIVLGGLLDVALSQRVNFSGGQASDDVNLGQLTFGGHIYVEGQTTQSGAVTAKHKMQLHNLTVDQATGKLHGDGPGWLSSVRMDQGQFAAAAGLPPAAASQPPPPGPRLLFLHVEFSRALDGNVNARHVEFSDQVQSIFGPVARWEDELDWRNPDSAGEQGATLRCERLAVGQMPGANPDAPAVELEATGSAVVEGQKFMARAARITYSQAKDQLIFAGDGRVDAEFFRKPRTNPLKADTVARTIMYWRRENRIEMSGGKYIDLSPYASELRATPRSR